MKNEGQGELHELTAGYLDGTLNEAQRERFEQLVRDNPNALKRVGDAVRFDVELRDALNPDHIELIEQRRMVIDRTTGKPVLVEKSQRVASRGEWAQGKRTAAKKSSRRWIVAGAALLGISAISVWQYGEHSRPPAATPQWRAVSLKNEGFEMPVALDPKTGESRQISMWQEKFETPNARLTNREAHSGSQSAALLPGGHLKQSLFRSDGAALNFEAGMKLRVSGWRKLEKPVANAEYLVRVDLHFVDERLKQYVVNHEPLKFSGADWQPFTVEFIVPPQKFFQPAWFEDASRDETQNIRGRQVLLSIFNDSIFKPMPATVCIDDLKAEWLPAEP